MCKSHLGEMDENNEYFFEVLIKEYCREKIPHIVSRFGNCCFGGTILCNQRNLDNK
ncbi:hypothetical protein D3C80_1308780 [compost metagenome]